MATSVDDLKLIGTSFLVDDLPVERAWLRRYFCSEASYRFAVYRLAFASLRERTSLRKFCQLFVDHTGFACSVQFLCRKDKQIAELLTNMERAVAGRNFDQISKIKSGHHIYSHGQIR